MTNGGGARRHGGHVEEDKRILESVGGGRWGEVRRRWERRHAGGRRGRSLAGRRMGGGDGR